MRFEKYEIPWPHAIFPPKATHELDCPIIANLCIFLENPLHLSFRIPNLCFLNISWVVCIFVGIPPLLLISLLCVARDFDINNAVIHRHPDVTHRSLKHLWTVWKALGQSGKLWDSLQRIWTVCKVSRKSGMFPDSL